MNLRRSNCSCVIPHCLTGLLLVAESQALEIASAQTRGNPNAATVTFSTGISESTATNANNYSINNGVTVSRVVVIETAKRVFTTLIVGSQAYTITFNGVQDRTNPHNTITPDSQATFLQTQGMIKRKEFDNIGGNLAENIANNTRYLNGHAAVTFPKNFGTPMNIGGSYGAQIQGFLAAPGTGD